MHEMALEMCRLDEECAEAFYIDDAVVGEYERDVFYHHHNMLVTRSGALAVLQEASLCNDTSIQALWLVSMRMTHHCEPNEVYELGTGCVCRRGKLCDEQEGYTYYGTPYLFVIVTIGTAAVIALSLFSIRTVIPMERLVWCTIEQITSLIRVPHPGISTKSGIL